MGANEVRLLCCHCLIGSGKICQNRRQIQAWDVSLAPFVLARKLSPFPHHGVAFLRLSTVQGSCQHATESTIPHAPCFQGWWGEARRWGTRAARERDRDMVVPYLGNCSTSRSICKAFNWRSPENLVENTFLQCFRQTALRHQIDLCFVLWNHRMGSRMGSEPRAQGVSLLSVGAEMLPDHMLLCNAFLCLE